MSAKKKKKSFLSVEQALQQMRTEKRRFFEGQVVFDLLAHSVAENNPDSKKQNTVRPFFFFSFDLFFSCV